MRVYLILPVLAGAVSKMTIMLLLNSMIPPNSIHQPSRSLIPQCQAWICPHLAMHLHIIQCTILYLGLHLFFTLPSHRLVDLSLVCLRIFELVVERRCMTSGALVMQAVSCTSQDSINSTIIITIISIAPLENSIHFKNFAQHRDSTRNVDRA